VPDGVGDGAALALLVQGLTAWHVLTNCARIRRGETVVVNAAAGGVGSLAVQSARHFGAGYVIGTASTQARRDLALSLGADVAVSSDPDGYADRVLDANDGSPVDIVLDSVGGRVFSAGLDVLANFGRLVTFGNSSREGRPLIDPAILADGNLAVPGFWLRPALTVPGSYAEPLAEMFALVAARVLKPPACAAYPLGDARRAFEDLLARRTTGKSPCAPEAVAGQGGRGVSTPRPARRSFLRRRRPSSPPGTPGRRCTRRRRPSGRVDRRGRSCRRDCPAAPGPRPRR
jgi:NADPH:quinone reductase